MKSKKNNFLILGLIIIVAMAIGSKYLIKEVFFPYKYKEYVNKYSEEYNLDPFFVLSVMKTESNFNKKAESNKNAIGLMQITLETGEWAAEKMELKEFSKEKLFDEEYNIRMGCWYLNELREMFDGNLASIIAGYNAGPGNVNKWLSDSKLSENGKDLSYIPFNETKKYLDKVTTYYNVYKYLYSNSKK
ncbi:lytic transglycosylase domain-containing protein [Clostridium botulinum]|uniref:lytic transglycosylase domain-containing protein n=1 Tax=Clostridium botulinum TaxID=1491 RepID=UPI000A16DB27|nr:lytic transglycosylase domain-containing protein [Clostridium botulinum]MBY6836793.1 lytic transglycosylase domain-containing protein [Clostridium botulinum]NFG66467.1 lytic transglycosylase domain-containing protein [Clostridium botulinum]NFH89588.1 lytic transglycosylase domain-containing protein [Clostridium botulinum]NFI19370.1 lytic transglycosylase domain-containing protein [Clostridium botulinum]NFL93247.1 lytic transglycosylase domain-containing protein [Clostridium botulinum]